MTAENIKLYFITIVVIFTIFMYMFLIVLWFDNIFFKIPLKQIPNALKKEIIAIWKRNNKFLLISIILILTLATLAIVIFIVFLFFIFFLVSGNFLSGLLLI